MNICITGATGFIGSHVVNNLKKKHKILVLTSKKTNKILNSNISKFNCEISKDFKDNILIIMMCVFLHMAGCNNSLKKQKQEKLLEFRRINRDF